LFLNANPRTRFEGSPEIGIVSITSKMPPVKSAKKLTVKDIPNITNSPTTRHSIYDKTIEFNDLASGFITLQPQIIPTKKKDRGASDQKSTISDNFKDRLLKQVKAFQTRSNLT